MAEPFIGEMSFFGCNYAPYNWAMCDGQLLPVSEFTALFSVIGTNYGGNGRTTFAVPDMKDCVPIQYGQRPGGIYRNIGWQMGEYKVTLNRTNLPSHTHDIFMMASKGDLNIPSANNSLLARGRVEFSSGSGENIKMYAPNNSYSNMYDGFLSYAGSSGAHENIQPSLALSCCIALEGVYPTRN